MTPAETLAAARGNVVGPYVPAREEWLEGCIVPIRWRGVRDGPWRMGVWGPLGSSSEAPVWGIVTSTDGHDVGYEKALDLTRPEVRDHLVRRGAPAWARDLPVALWVWATTGRAPRFVLHEWDGAWSPRVDRWSAAPVSGACLSTMNPEACLELEDWSGWQLRVPSGAPKIGPETGPEGMACADLAALSRGCILDEPDGWLLPLPDGGVGFWPES